MLCKMFVRIFIDCSSVFSAQNLVHLLWWFKFACALVQCPSRHIISDKFVLLVWIFDKSNIYSVLQVYWTKWVNLHQDRGKTEFKLQRNCFITYTWTTHHLDRSMQWAPAPIYIFIWSLSPPTKAYTTS